MLFLSGGHLCVRMGYTPPQVIKEEKKDEERVGNFGESKREKVGKLKGKKKNERGGSEGFGFLVFFIFV